MTHTRVISFPEFLWADSRDYVPHEQAARYITYGHPEGYMIANWKEDEKTSVL